MPNGIAHSGTIHSVRTRSRQGLSALRDFCFMTRRAAGAPHATVRAPGDPRMRGGERSWRQPLDRPASVGLLEITHTVVQPVRRALPELDRRRSHAIAAPV